MATIIFGGAFDPPHREHVRLLKAAVEELNAERAVIVPTYFPQHKSQGVLPFDARAELCRAAFCGEVGADIIIDETERERGRDNYTCLVLPELKKKYGDVVYLIGGDSLEYLPTWKKPAEILSVCPLAVAGREGFAPVSEVAANITARYGGTVRVLDFVGKEVSSGRIRAEFFLGENSDLVPEAVGRTVRERGFYRDYAETVTKVRDFESAELYEHTRQVVFRAVDLNSAHNLKCDFRKVFLAALLHDNAKQRPSLDGLSVPADSVGTSVLHQFLGAEKAKRDFGVTDDEILNAVRYHTTAKPEMTVFEKLIYTADSTSYDREYEPIPVIRAIADEDFEKGFLSVLEYTYMKLVAKGGAIYPLTEDAVRYYLPDIAGWA